MSVVVRAGAGIAGLAFLAGCQLVLDFAELADGGAADGGAADAGGADAAPLCTELEPNGALDQALDVEPGTFQAAICPAGDEDFYRFALDGNSDLDILLTFQAGDSDLELELYHQLSGMRLVFSTGTDGDEQIARTFAQGNRLTAGTYVMRVFGRDAAVQNDYEVTWSTGPAVRPGP
jgi:hypothetical protein